MAKHIHEGWSKPGDEIPQPTDVMMGRNLRPPQPELSEREKVLASITQYIANERAGDGYLQALKTQRPDVRRRAAELFAALGAPVREARFAEAAGEGTAERRRRPGEGVSRAHR
jgi:hypothetical protein